MRLDGHRAGIVVLLLALPVAAQERIASDPDDSDFVFRSESKLVVLHTTVVDRHGRLVRDLKPEAFRVYENGVEQPLRLFRSEDVPVSLGIIVDNSGSMANKRQKVEAAALRLVKASNPQDEVFVVNFNDDAVLDLPHGKAFTNDIREMEQALVRINSRGSTAMRDALRVSIDHLNRKARKDKKVLLVITDGNDNISSMSQQSLVRMAQQSEVLIYAIGLLNEEDPGEARKARRSLDQITQATGGKSLYPKELADVDQIAQQVARDVRNQYVLGYTPANADLDGSYRKIKVVVKGPNRPVARTRAGYYATPGGASQRVLRRPQ
jgi:Ca-activated chloride channel homolog